MTIQRLIPGDAVVVLRTLPDASVDSIVTDPPYGLEFMGKEWDGADGFRRSLNPNDAGRDNAFGRTSRTSPEYRAGALFQKWCEEWSRECLRVLKPGGAFVAFGGTRTWHRLACAVEDAGFEIRDSIAWMHGQGFPKSLNVTKALESLPPCRCGVGSEVARDGLGVENAGGPASAVGAGARAEAGAVPLAGGAADSADGIGAQLLPDSTGRGQVVNPLDVDGGWQSLPVVLGPTSVAGAAEREQVSDGVRGVEVDPESLRDEVVRNEVSGDPAVGAGAITSDDGGRDVRPSPSLVLPLATSPGGVSGAVEAGPIVGGHAGAGAIDPGVGPSSEGVAANGADVDAVPGALHGLNSTAQSAVRCEDCGGVRGPIPQGLGTALKPAFEPIVVARKPLSEKTVVKNVLKHGIGALNIDGCRVGTEGSTTRGANGSNAGKARNTLHGGNFGVEQINAGRWPANVILDESQAAALDQQTGVLKSGKDNKRKKPHQTDAMAGLLNTLDREEVSYGDSGGASRFFYCPKATKKERPIIENEDGTRIVHPTVKPLALMQWLVRLVTPPGGVVLDPFLGSGTTMEAAQIEGFDCLGVERDESYLNLIQKRCPDVDISEPVASLELDGPTLPDENEPEEHPVDDLSLRRHEASSALASEVDDTEIARLRDLLECVSEALEIVDPSNPVLMALKSVEDSSVA